MFLTLSDYINLDISSRASYLWDNGVFINSVKRPTQSNNLYFIHGFYVEVTIDNFRTEILSITPLETEYQIDKYLEDININL